MNSVVKIKETKIKTSNTPTPKDPPDKLVNRGGLPMRELTVEEQEVLRRTLMCSVTIIDEGKLEQPLNYPER